jgi:hypothetical protein
MFLAVFVMSGAAMSATADAQARQAKSAAPLTLRATCDAQSDVPTLRVQIVNMSSGPASVVVGFTAADGKTHVVNSVDVIAIRLATGASEDYLYVNPKYALAKGAPWIVLLAPGATHDMALPLVDFISTLNYNTLSPLVAGGTRVTFTARAATKSSPAVWTGTIETMLDACKQ